MAPLAKPVRVEVADRIGVVTLDRPERRNALDSATLTLLPRVLGELRRGHGRRRHRADRCGSRVLCRLDLEELATTGANLRAAPLPDLITPLIGAINGPAVTGGLELALACDSLVASDRARFGDTHARVGIHPGWGLTVLLPRAVGMRRAREMSATGRLIDAPTALSWGLVNQGQIAGRRAEVIERGSKQL